MICSGAIERNVPLDFDDNFQGWVYDLEDYRFIDRSLGLNQERLTKAENFMMKLAKVCGYSSNDGSSSSLLEKKK